MRKLFITFILFTTIIGFCGCAHNTAGNKKENNSTVISAATTTITEKEKEEVKSINTNGISPQISVVEIKKPQTTTLTTITTTTTTTTTVTPKIEEFIVYKPSTHYIHRSTCYWVNSECYKIDNTKDIEARLCDECNPDIKIEHLYVEPQTTTITTTTITTTTPTKKTSISEITDYEYQLLAEIVDYEAGADCINLYNKAKIVAGIMNRVNDSRFPSTIYGVLTQPRQFSNYYPGCKNPSQVCYDAVDYYFSHQEEFNNDNSWYGDGYQNHFYYS